MRLRNIKPGDRTVFIGLGILSSLIILAAYWYRPWFLTAVDLKATDAMFAARAAGSAKAPSDIVIIAVDEKSVNELGRWPWPRTKTALLIRSLKPAKVVALDMVFSEPENERADSELSKAIKESGNVVLGYFFRDDTDSFPDPAFEAVQASKINLIQSIDGSDIGSFPGPEFPGVEVNTKKIAGSAAGFGAFNIIPQADGIYRTSNILFKYDSGIYPSLSLEAVRRYLGGQAMLTIAEYGVDGLSIGDRSVPLDEAGAFTLNFYGRGGSFKTYSASDVINGKIPSSEFKGKLVFAGVTEKAIYDIRPAPVDSLFPGVELQATVAGNIISEHYLIHDSRVILFDLFLIVFLPLVLSVIIASVRSTFVSLIAASSLMAFLIIGDFFLFSRYSIKTGVIYPALSLIAAYLTSEAYRNIVVEKKSRYLRKAFSTYVSSQLVSEILKDPARLKLGGEKRVITVLFSDIRGFTSLSEKLSPEELVKLLNEYLNPMTAIVLNEEGMLDKYIGDAIMAVFNAPLEIPDHPKRTCITAVKMMEKLKDLNAKWAVLGYPPLEIGIGINTGEAVVGNMGAELRFDYTAIGDTVNLASRLEGMNKLYGTAIVVSEFTYEHVKDDFIFRELDLVRVKGKAKPIVMYELMGVKNTSANDELLRRFRGALTLFRTRKFGDAKSLFTGILESYPDDGPSRLYIKRCDEYMESPPPDDWDGVYVAKTK